MAVEAAKMPEWLDLLKVAAYLISAAGFVLNYSLRKRSQRHLTVQVKVFYRRLRGTPIRLLQWCSQSILKLFSTIYGDSWWHRIAVAVALSVAYFFLMLWQVRPPPDSLRALRQEKADLERQADKRLYHLPEKDRKEAAEHIVVGTGGASVVVPKHQGAVYDQIREQLGAFPTQFQSLLDKSPHRGEIAWLAFREGTYLSPGFKYGHLLSLLLWNVFIDLFAWIFTIFAIRRWMAGGEQIRRFSLGLGAILTVVALSFALSLFAYAQFLRGFHQVFWFLFAIPLLAAVGLMGIVLLWPDSSKEREALGCGGTILGTVFVAMSILLIWHLIKKLHLPELPPFTWDRPYQRLPYLLAASTVLPLALALALMVGSLIAKLFATATKSLLLHYLRIIFRLDQPALLLLTATPGAVAIFLAEVYPVFHKLLPI